jgi:hypothetical protein
MAHPTRAIFLPRTSARDQTTHASACHSDSRAASAPTHTYTLTPPGRHARLARAAHLRRGRRTIPNPARVRHLADRAQACYPRLAARQARGGRADLCPDGL